MKSQRHHGILAAFTVAIFSACGGDSKPTESVALSLSTASNVIQLAPGQSKSVAFTIGRVGAITGDVSLATTGVPQGLTAAFVPATLTGFAGAANLEVSVTPQMAAGTYDFTARATAPDVEPATVQVSVVVSLPSITLALGSGTVSLAQGSTTTVPVTITRSSGYTGTIALSVEGLPTGVTGTFTPTTLDGSQSSGTLAITAGLAAAVASTNITVQATPDGAAVKTQTLQLSITPATAPAILLTAVPATTTLARTLSGNIALSIARFGGFDDAVQIEFENLPANVVATAPPIAAGATNTTLTITPGLQALLGVNTFTIRATGQGVTPSVQSFQLTILEEPGFRLSFFAGAGNPSTPTLTASFKKINSPTFTAIITRIGGFDEPITISAIDVPAGMTVTVTPSVANAQTNSVTLQFSVLNSFNAGVYVLKLRGVASGGKTFDATMTITVEL